MAKWLLNPMAEGIRNKVGNLVFFPGKNGAVLSRTRVTPNNPQTAIQQAVRGSFGSASGVWATATLAQREGWNTLAGYYQRLDKDNKLYFLSGAQLCCLVNTLRLMDSAATSAVPPAGPPPLIVAGITGLEIAASGLTASIGVTYGNDGAIGMRILMTPPIVAAQDGYAIQRSDYRVPFTTLNESLSSVTITAGVGNWSFSMSALRAPWASLAEDDIVHISALAYDPTTYLPQIGDFGLTDKITVTQAV